MNKLLHYIISKQHHKFRHTVDWNLGEEYSKKGLTPIERMTDRFERLIKEEKPVILPDEKICFIRTVANIPDCFTEKEWEDIKSKHYIHELGYISNLSPDYERILSMGLLKARETADEYSRRSIDAIIDLADRYKAEAEKIGRTDIVEVLNVVPRYPATNLREAMQFFRIVHYALWLEGNYHNTVGRLDKYMYPYFKKDMDAGVYTMESALELVEDFFLSFNKDSDTYVGVQQGDNGQSLALGGLDENGNEVFNDFSKLCLKASNNLKLIDPKINLRVNKNTPIEIYELGTELTKAGLGFPQYNNDDIVIPALEALGYEHNDAVNYVTAACWEFIIPAVGADVANIAALSYPKVIDKTFHNDLPNCATFEEYYSAVEKEIAAECDRIVASVDNLWFVPSPFMKVMMNVPDINVGGKYNNFGVHGTGIATGADSLMAIKKYVFDEKKFTAHEYIKAVDENFQNNPEMLSLLRYETAKFGQNNDEVDALACRLVDSFAKSINGRKNCRGGIWKAGTGSAMFYLWHAAEIGASPDGRLDKEPFGTNFSCSIYAKIPGPISVISSFAKPDFSKAINGGPLTLEFHGGMFNDADSIGKVARLVKQYFDLGGHQMQLNAVNAEAMRDAQLHPENHAQLVVRIWGWSAYFVELDKEYQDHVMMRQEYTV